MGGVKSMWVIVMFDLPTETKKNKRDYRRFVDFLLSDGFTLTQFSIYTRPCANWEAAQKHGDRVEAKLPPEGQVRMLTLTSRQMERMRIFYGKSPGEPEQLPLQLTFY
jgi:CRISPR-associated protein Cas2